jgi:hypothetical protein
VERFFRAMLHRGILRTTQGSDHAPRGVMQGTSRHLENPSFPRVFDESLKRTPKSIFQRKLKSLARRGIHPSNTPLRINKKNYIRKRIESPLPINRGVHQTRLSRS